ncbi:hypothetical protein DFS33DRAFT_1353829 [Desarmillaria ectypa]|nr:hypothetical protein DFS33DRAFT_1353829 [Desarmillaria ectypa]
MFSNQCRDFNNCPLCGPIARQIFPQNIRSPRVLQLLQCNDPPTDAELSEFQDTVKRAPGRIAELDERITHARKMLDALVLERISIEADAADAKALSSPVRRLPPDVLRAICLYTIPSALETMQRSDYLSSLNHKESPWTVSQVCRDWRSIIVSSPELWSSTSLFLSNLFSSSTFCQMFMLGLRLERSQNAPLTVACFSNSDISSHPLLSLVITRVSAIKNLRIESPFQSLTALSFCRGRLERLYDLKIDTSNTNWGPFATTAERTIDALEYAPNLRMFSAYGMLPQPIPIVPWAQLTHLRLQIDRLRELEILRQANNVQDLEIRTGGTFSVPEGHSAVSLHFLSSLTLLSKSTSGRSPDVRFMFSLLSVPNVVDLHLIYAGTPVLPHIKAQNKITTLEIRRLLSTAGSSSETFTVPGLLKLLNSVGNLQHLILKSARALSIDDISLLNPSSANIPLPHLKTLDVGGCTFKFDHSVFVGMIEARRQGSDPKWDQIETVYLGSSLVLDDLAARIWRDLLNGGLKVVYGESK